MEKITGFEIFFGSILIGHLERELPSTYIPHVCKKCFLVLGSGFFYLAFLYISRSFNKVCLGWRSPSLLKHSPNRLNGRGCFTSGAKSFRTENFQNFPAFVRSCESTKRTGTTQNNIMLPKELLPDFI